MVYPPKDLLNTSGFFLCEKSQCILRHEICWKRQRLSKTKATGEFYMCFDCRQGREIKALVKGKTAYVNAQEKNTSVYAAAGGG